MIKALVSIDADLPSSIALRYTCQLAKLKEVEIQTIHIHEPEAAGPGIGTGWARRTYEKELVEESKKEISQLLIAESGFCPVLNQPLILSGDREKEILEEIQKGGYDLFVEGMSVRPTSKVLNRHLKSHLYQHLPIPALLVQNLFPLKRVLLALENNQDPAVLFQTVDKLFQGVDLEVDLLPLGVAQGSERDAQVASMKEWAENQGWKIHKVYPFEENLDRVAQQVEQCSLVATVVARHIKGKFYPGPLVEFLARLNCPTLFCWK